MADYGQLNDANAILKLICYYDLYLIFVSFKVSEITFFLLGILPNYYLLFFSLEAPCSQSLTLTRRKHFSEPLSADSQSKSKNSTLLLTVLVVVVQNYFWLCVSAGVCDQLPLLIIHKQRRSSKFVTPKVIKRQIQA